MATPNESDSRATDNLTYYSQHISPHTRLSPPAPCGTLTLPLTLLWSYPLLLSFTLSQRRLLPTLSQCRTGPRRGAVISIQLSPGAGPCSSPPIFLEKAELSWPFGGHLSAQARLPGQGLAGLLSHIISLPCS